MQLYQRGVSGMKDYDTETAQKRIEMLCTQKGMKPTVVARESGAGTNSIANLKRGSMLSADKLAKIADYLECSVDYLLGRTDNPVQANSTEAYHVSGDNNGVQSNKETINISKPEDKSSDSTTEAFIEAFKSLELPDRVDVMKFTFDKIRKEA